MADVTNDHKPRGGKHQKPDALRAPGARSHLKSKCQECGWSRWPVLLSRLVLAGPRLGTASLQSPSPSSLGLLLCLSLHLSLPPPCLIRTSVLNQGWFHCKISNLVTSAKTLLLYKVTVMVVGVRTRIFGGHYWIHSWALLNRRPVWQALPQSLDLRPMGGGQGEVPSPTFSRINPCSQSQPELLLAAAKRLPWGQTVVTWMDLSGSDWPGGWMQGHYQLPSRG